MKTINATEVKNRLGRYLQEAVADPVFIEKNRRTVAVLLSYEEYERLSRLEESYWAGKAREAEAEGYLGEKESMTFIRTTGRAET